LKILGRLMDMLGDSRSISDVHRFLMKKFKILSEVEMDSYDVENDVRTDPKAGAAYIVNESGILNYAFQERMKTPLDMVLDHGSTTVRSYKWNTQYNGNEYINCYFSKNRLIGFGYTFYPLESSGDEVKRVITSKYSMVNDLLSKKYWKPKEETTEFRQPSYFVNNEIFSSTFLAFCGSTLFLFNKNILKDSFVSEKTQ
jgi:hypothetical protein